jgi:hypothetical protein
MSMKAGQRLDDISSAPESGTVRDDTSGNQPSDRGVDPGQCGAAAHGSDHPLVSRPDKDDPSIASEER